MARSTATIASASSLSGRDGAVYRDDRVGLFLCADPEGKRVLQIYMSAAGAVFDREIFWIGPDRTEGEGPEWNGAFTTAAKQADGSWSAEFRIPYASLDAQPPTPGTTWRIHFRRKEIDKGSSADWQVPIGYDPARFGYLPLE